MRNILHLQHLRHHPQGKGPRIGQNHSVVHPQIYRQRVRFGNDIELSEEKQEILRKAEEYIDSHAGYRYLNRMRTEKFFEHQFENKIRAKEKELEETNPEDQERMKKLKDHLEQLNSAYRSVLPKTPTSWEDLRERDEEED